jgi:hypothetical protein
MSCANFDKNLHKITLFTTFIAKFGKFNFSTCVYCAGNETGQGFPANSRRCGVPAMCAGCELQWINCE